MSAVILEGRYALGRELGVGGYARVYEAKDLKINRAVAVKLVSPQFASHQEATQRLEREGRIAAALAHPNICAVTDVGRLEGGRPFIVLEKLVGETLATRLAHGSRLPPDVALDFAVQLLTALGVAHVAGIVHRDIKPENIFLVDIGNGRSLLKLLDFGLAQVPGMPTFDGATLTQTGFVVGTAAYMSPDQVRGVRDFDVRSDVYSAAVLVYELFAGVRPFHDLPPLELFDAIGHKKPPSLGTHKNVPPAVVRAVDAALNVQREHRPANASIFLAKIRDRAPQATGVTLVLPPDAVPMAAAAPIADEWDLPTRQAMPAAADVDFNPDGEPRAIDAERGAQQPAHVTAPIPRVRPPR